MLAGVREASMMLPAGRRPPLVSQLR